MNFRENVKNPHQVKPRIGMTYTGRKAGLFDGGEDQLEKYKVAVTANGGIIVPLKQNEKKERLLNLINQLDGLLLPGGRDIDPVHYGQKIHPSTELVYKGFDQFEFDVLKEAFRLKMPVLAICRGLQVVNVFQGGDLIQDVDSLYSHPLKMVHRVKLPGKAESEPHYHMIDVDEGSVLYSITGCSPLMVNSTHHQIADKIGADLKITARSQDQAVEALEACGKEIKSPLLAVQFHPEKLRIEDPFWDAPFVWLIEKSLKFSTASGHQ